MGAAIFVALPVRRGGLLLCPRHPCRRGVPPGQRRVARRD